MKEYILGIFTGICIPVAKDVIIKIYDRRESRKYTDTTLYEPRMRSRIVLLLKDNPKGLTFRQICKKLHYWKQEYPDVSNALAYLMNTKEIVRINNKIYKLS